MMVYLEMIQADDEKNKFERLYYRYRNLMYHIACQVTGNQEDAEDAVQQAFLYVVENLGKVDSVSGTRTRSFLSIITEHKAIDIVRKRYPVIELDAAESELAVSLPEDSGELVWAMAKLPKRYQDVLLLHYHNGYSAHEIAEMLGTSPTAIRKSIWRAKDALGKLLSEKVTGA